MTGIILSTMIILLVIDILSNISMDFGKTSFSAETFNLNKVLHPVVFILGIGLTLLFDGYLGDVISGSLFILLAIFKGTSMMRNTILK